MRRLSYTATIEDELTGQAVKDIVRKKFDISHRLKSKLKKFKLVYINGKVAEGWYPVYAGDIVEIELPEEVSGFEPEDIPLDVIYEDEDILVINKQPFICVHPTKGQKNHTLANAAQHHMTESGESYKIRFVNRLDRDTSGLIVLGKNSHSQDNICRQMRDHNTDKYYLAIVREHFGDSSEPEYIDISMVTELSGGICASAGDTLSPHAFDRGMASQAFGKEGTIDLPLGHPDPDKVERGVVEGGHPSRTQYKVLAEGYLDVSGFGVGSAGGFDVGAASGAKDSAEHEKNAAPGSVTIKNKIPVSLVRLKLETGRTHQIRVHLSAIGHPVLGDHLYGGLLGCEGAAYDYNKNVENCPRECVACERNLTPIRRQALHAYEMCFDHPVSGERLSFKADPPEDMQKLIWQYFPEYTFKIPVPAHI